jgi:hypothetical protein
MQHPSLFPALVLLGSALTAQAGTVDGGGAAPVNCWYTEGGCAARTGFCLTRPLKRKPQPAWKLTLREGGVYEDEPRVWRDVVLLCEARTGVRILHSHNLEDGEVYCRPLVFQTDRPLAPSIWRNHVAVRANAKTVEVYRLSRPVAELVQRFEFSDPVSAPLFFRDEIYVANGALHRMQVGKTKPVWKVGESVYSEVSLRGRSVFAVIHGSGGSKIVSFDRDTGRQKNSVPGIPGKRPDASRFPVVAVGEDYVVARGDPQFDSSFGGSNVNTIDVDWPRAHGRSRYHYLTSLPCIIGPSWIGRDEMQGRVWFERRRGDSKSKTGYLVLANTQRHRKLLSSEVASSAASGVVFLGNIAFDVRRSFILWRHELGVEQRSVPARDSLIVTDKPNHVVVFRGQAPAAGWRGMLKPVIAAGPSVPAPGKHASATLITPSGVHKRGTVTLDAGQKFSVGRGKTLQMFAKNDVSMMLDKTRAVVYWNGKPADVARGLSALIEKQVDKEFIAIARKSVTTNDVTVIRRYLSEAIARGATKTDISMIERNLRRIAGYKHRVRPSQVAMLKKAEKALYAKSLKKNWDVYTQMVDQQPFVHALASSVVMLERDAALYDRICERLKRFEGKVTAAESLAWMGALLDGAPSRATIIWQRVSDMLGKLDRTQKIRIARWFLDIDPRHAGASKLVRSMNPIEVPGVDKITALEWLDLLESAQDVKFKVVRLPKSDAKFTPSPEIRELHRQRTRWRKDIVAIQSDSVVIFTPLANPGRIARCLSMGELVCETLQHMFSYSGKKRDDPLRLKILLYSSQAEYLKQSARAGAGHVSWSAGHYDHEARIARMFLPEGGGAFDSVMDVFAHELTHYWVDVRCPLFDNYNKMMLTRGPGFWIVEGFASLLEEFSYDLSRREVFWVKPSSHSLDVVANARRNQLLPWKDIFRISQFRMHTKLSPKPFGTVTTRWSVGMVPVMTPIGVFYRQSTAAAHYLYSAEGGKYRKKLLEYLGHYYRGEFRKLNIQKVFGLSANELGKRIVAYSKRISGGG